MRVVVRDRIWKVCGRGMFAQYAHIISNFYTAGFIYIVSSWVRACGCVPLRTYESILFPFVRLSYCLYTYIRWGAMIYRGTVLMFRVARTREPLVKRSSISFTRAPAVRMSAWFCFSSCLFGFVCWNTVEAQMVEARVRVRNHGKAKISICGACKCVFIFTDFLRFFLFYRDGVNDWFFVTIIYILQ